MSTAPIRIGDNDSMSELRILVIEHEDGAGPKRFGDWLSEAGAEVDVLRPYLGDEIPTGLQSSAALHGSAADDGYAALLVLGGSAGPLEDTVNPWLPKVRSLLRDSAAGEFPSFNICLGGELLAAATSARIFRRDRPQIGIYDLHATSAGRRILCSRPSPADRERRFPRSSSTRRRWSCPRAQNSCSPAPTHPCRGTGSANSRGAPSSIPSPMPRRSHSG